MFGATGKLPEIGQRFEEGAVKMGRASEGKGTEDQSPPRVVILGGGYGGVYTALIPTLFIGGRIKRWEVEPEPVGANPNR